MKKSLIMILALIGLGLSASAQQHNNGVTINGITWATKNVGAPGTFVDNYWEGGMYYQWNRKVGRSSTDSPASDAGYTSRWNYSQGLNWDKINDPCPSGWRVPTADELSLLENSGSIWTKINGVYGRLFGTDAKTIFLPASGHYSNRNGKVFNFNMYGCYWSSKPGKSYDGAYELLFNDSNVYVIDSFSEDGNLVRCVKE